MKSFTLYLDESGEFKDDRTSHLTNPSVVGGFLCQDTPEIGKFLRGLPSGLHASEHYDKSYLKLLQKAQAVGGQFVIFENTEKLYIVSGDITYLNIITEGLVKTLMQLAEDNQGHEVHLTVQIAKRVKTSARSQKKSEKELELIAEDDYQTKLEERLLLAVGNKGLTDVHYSVAFGSARQAGPLQLADLICNTYYTRTAKEKFTEEERETISALFESSFVFPVFDTSPAGYLRSLYLEKRYSEMCCRICELPSMTGITALRNRLLDRIQEMTSRERDIFFSTVSLQISRYNIVREFDSGIIFAENYKKRILNKLTEKTAGENPDDLQGDVDYWIFDTDFFILTMYDHMGYTGKCDEYLRLCRDNISAVNDSWEHMDYYFSFRIRELNCLIGRFEFDRVLEESDKLISILADARELFNMIGSYDSVDREITSELLGKVFGVRLEACINLLHERPELLEEALELSDKAIHEFSAPEDIRRQLQYRSQLFAEIGEYDDSRDALLRSWGITTQDGKEWEHFVERACPAEGRMDAFSLMHCTNVMLAAVSAKTGDAGKIEAALIGNPRFIEMVSQENAFGHPWQIFFWNLAKYYRSTGRKEKYQEFYRKAYAIAAADPEKATMYSFAISMEADNLRWLMEQGDKAQKKALNSLVSTQSKFSKRCAGTAMGARFDTYTGLLTDENLAKTADGYLR